MPTQNVNLTPQLEGFVKSQVSSGFFNNASEVHRAALSEMARREEERQLRMERLRLEAKRGLDDIANGRFQEISGADGMAACLDGILADISAEATRDVEPVR